jgi:Cd2+/Zn2+-exporting ATPase
MPVVEAVRATTGRGLTAEWENQLVRVGSLSWLAAQGVEVGAESQAEAGRLEAEGQTVVALAVAGQVAGLLGLADRLRPSARAALDALTTLGIRDTVMLTGDNARAAGSIAAQAGVARVQAGLMPADKLEAVKALVRSQGYAGMVGDGVNDAPALAHASVGIAMGGAATAVALETADVALLGANLERLPFAIGLGRAARAITTQNLAIALSVIAFLLAATVTGGMGLGLAVLLHEGSTLAVVLNALRLLGYRGPAAPRARAAR